VRTDTINNRHVEDWVLNTPRLSMDEAVDLARRVYGIDAIGSPLPSERDQNVLLQSGDQRSVLKVANALEARPLLEAQNAALAHVARRTTLCPRVVAALDGRDIVDVTTPSAGRYLIRMFSWLPGVPLGTLDAPPPALFESLGAAVAELDTALQGFDHPAVHREFHWDLSRGLSVCRELLAAVDDDGSRTLVTRLLERIELNDAARFARLRRAVVHNDPNDFNVLVDLPAEAGSHADDVVSGFSRKIAGSSLKITGVLDFGDIVYSYAIADLAIAVAYAVLGKDDPLEVAVAVVRGYQRTRTLDDDEIDSLLGLILLRLCTSVCVAARHSTRAVHRAYASKPDKPTR